jgi:hypothetical protein
MNNHMEGDEMADETQTGTGGDEMEVTDEMTIIEEEWEEDYEDLSDWDDDEDEMGMRDWVAGLALQAILDAEEDSLKDNEQVKEHALDWARRSYIIADAMLVAREEGVDGWEFDEDEGEDGEKEEG